MAVELYRLPGCPYCRKVEEKLASLDVEYVSHDVPASKPDRTTVREISGQSGVPVIVDEEHGVDAMAESDDIVTYLEQTYA